MFRVALCDDQEYILVQLKKLLCEIFKKKDCQYVIEAFSSGEELISKNEYYDMIFLDIEMPGMDGIQAGEIIRQRNMECKIIMATSAVERYKEAFHIRAFRFVTKPFVADEIEEAVDAVLSLKKDDDSIELYYQRILCKVKLKDIQYIQAYNGYSEFLVGNRIFRKEVSLNNMEELLDRQFFSRIHRQYIINMRWITSYDNGEVIVGNQVIPVSKRKRKEFEQEYMEFDLKYGRGK